MGSPGGMFILVRNSWRICNASRLFRVPKYGQTFTDGIAIAQYAERRSFFMPEKQTMKRARRAKREGKAPSTQAGEFVREEIHHIREGKHGARSTKQAIAIGLSKARRAGVKLAPPRKGKVSESTRRNAERDYQASHKKKSPSSGRRSKARQRALKREGHSAASPKALQKQARSAARRRSRASRSEAARRAARTKGGRGRSMGARKAARTRARRK